MDPYELLDITLNPDGSLTRPYIPSFTLPSDADDQSSAALWKDVPLNPSHNTWIRIFIPRQRPCSPEKLPVIIEHHGGGFVFFSAAHDLIHRSSARLAANLPAVVLSVEYRLAPEHRLPAAYDDAVDALRWLQSQALDLNSADPWLRSAADFARCFLMGSSAGGNIAYHAAIRSTAIDLEPLRIEGLILIQPYFGGVDRTASELRLAEDRIVPLPVNDLLWELALPAGAGREHEFCDAAVTATTAAVKGLARCFVRGYVGDPLIDRMRGLVRMLEAQGVRVVAQLEDDGFHGCELFLPEKAAATEAGIKEFVRGSTSGGSGSDDGGDIRRQRL